MLRGAKRKRSTQQREKNAKYAAGKGAGAARRAGRAEERGGGRRSGGSGGEGQVKAGPPRDGRCPPRKGAASLLRQRATRFERNRPATARARGRTTRYCARRCSNAEGNRRRQDVSDRIAETVGRAERLPPCC